MSRCWLEELPPELVADLLWLLRIADRVALLEVVGCPLVRRLYRNDLARRCRGAAILSAVRILGRQGKYQTMVETKHESIGDGNKLSPVHILDLPYTRLPNQIILSRFGDAFRGAVVFGENIQWLEVMIGMQPTVGTRVYYKRARPEASVVVYDFPEFVDDFKGLPVVALMFVGVTLRCNPTGVIHRIISTFDRYYGPERTDMIENCHIGFKGKVRLKISKGCAQLID